ncbi:MFS transporter [Nocardia panacis]|uniref:MFS transporter n=1 Tax=Nocardia panacis TaxID=2340916 RepID=A0A3A4KJ22_9NOCA|nr:Cmx/CmrA family chloramphenicol efflux MFS transporter [Nocardia panacis]RJO69173.1 MFS transporter [Nocardia panacis]
MPIAVYVLGLSIFAQGTSELMLAGLLTEMSNDLGVSIPQAGLLISAFAIGMLVGAPVLAAVTLRWSRRRALLVFLAIFLAAHLLGAMTSNYWVLIGTRVVAAFVYAGFWAVGAATAIGIVAPTARGRAMGILAGGLTVATIIGLPAGTLIGQLWGWRSAFLGVAVLSALAMIGVATRIPNERAAETPDLRRELRSLINPQVWLSYATTAVATAGLLVSFSYLGALLTNTTGLPDAWVPAVLGVYGLGAVLGILVGGRTADTHPLHSMYLGFTGLIATSILLALTAQYPAPTLIAAFLLGAFGFGTNPTLSSRIFGLAKQGPTLGAAFNISAFNIGITVGPWLGGLAIGGGLGYPSVAWIGAALGAAAIGTVLWGRVLDRTGTVPTKQPLVEITH